MKLAILKLGGSTFSDKTEPLSYYANVVDRVASEVARVVSEGIQVVVIHGGGSYGHPFVKATEAAGIPPNTAFSLIHLLMHQLSLRIARSFFKAGLHPIIISPSTISYDSHPLHLWVKPVQRALRSNLIPILHGDAIPSERGYLIVSGDAIAAALAIHLQAERLVFAMDADGIYTENPKWSSSARLIPKLTPKDVQNLRFEASTDVTGGVQRKLQIACHVAKKGIPVLFINALVENRVYLALKGQPVRCTLLVPNAQEKGRPPSSLPTRRRRSH